MRRAVGTGIWAREYGKGIDASIGDSIQGLPVFQVECEACRYHLASQMQIKYE